MRRLNRYHSLDAFLRSEPELARTTLGNAQTAYLAGAEAVAAYASAPDRLLALACEHLDACGGVLLVDRLVETLGLIDHGWGERARRTLARDNVTAGRPALAEHDPQTLEALAEMCALDMELYRLAEQMVTQGGPARRRPAPFAVAEPAASDFRFDAPIPGFGWHVRECVWRGPGSAGQTRRPR